MFTTPWISRVAAVLFLILVLGAAYVFVLEPIVLSYRETDLRIEETREQLVRYHRLAAMRPDLERQMEQSAAKAATEGYYLIGGTDAVAAAGLQDRVNALVQESGGSLRSIQPMPGTDEQGFRRITLRVQMMATNEALFEILYALEAGAPILFIENLDVQSRVIRRRADKVAQRTTPDAPLLTVGFDLSGYMPVRDQ
jgi:general secretion pathway protein M